MAEIGISLLLCIHFHNARLAFFRVIIIVYSYQTRIARNMVLGEGFQYLRHSIGGFQRGGIPSTVGVWSGEGAVPPLQKFRCIFSFKMVHFHAFWGTYIIFTPTVIVTDVHDIDSNILLNSVQQKGRPRNLCVDFSGVEGGSTPTNPLRIRAWFLQSRPRRGRRVGPV